MKFLAILLISLTLACQSKSSEPQAQTEAPVAQVEKSAGDGDEHAEHADEHDHHYELGKTMFTISTRFSHIWYAGQAGNAEMVKYQTHELEEIGEELKEENVVEGKVVVGEDFQKTLYPHFEAMEEAVAKKDMKAFEAAYDTAISNCNRCHTMTGYGHLQVGRPTFNPYPNLKL